MRQIERWIPEAAFIHMIRDGRDAALSRSARMLKDKPPMAKVAERWKSKIERAREDARRLRRYTEIRYEDLVTDTEPVLRSVCELVELEWDPAMLRYHETAAERLEAMHRDLPEEPGRPRRPADHRLEAHKLAMKPPDPTRLARWKREMDAADVAEFERVAGELLAAEGYELSGAASTSGAEAGR
jgi:hypothetical protein